MVGVVDYEKEQGSKSSSQSKNAVYFYSSGQKGF